MIPRSVSKRQLVVANPKHISDVVVGGEMLGHDQRNRINEFEDAETDHKALDGRIWRVVARVSDLFNHRVLRVLAVPSVSETNESEVYSLERAEKSFCGEFSSSESEWLCGHARFLLSSSLEFNEVGSHDHDILLKTDRVTATHAHTFSRESRKV